MPGHCAPIPPPNVTYLCLVDFGPKLGRAWAERPIERANYADTIADIRSGQLPPVIQVLEIEPTPHALSGHFSTRDVTLDMLEAAAVAREPLEAEVLRGMLVDHDRELKVFGW
jgi:hypothetical protein